VSLNSKRGRLSRPSINAAAGYCARRHIGLASGLEFLRNSRATCIFDTAKRICTIPVISRYDDGNKLAVPMLCQGSQKHRDNIEPSPRFGNRHQPEFALENIQVALRRDNENVVRLKVKSFRDQLDRHQGMTREYLMQQRLNQP
jgi:hypothetical protein